MLAVRPRGQAPGPGVRPPNFSGRRGSLEFSGAEGGSVVLDIAEIFGACLTQLFRTAGPGPCPPPANQAFTGGSGGFPPGSEEERQRALFL